MRRPMPYLKAIVSKFSLIAKRLRLNLVLKFFMSSPFFSISEVARACVMEVSDV